MTSSQFCPRVAFLFLLFALTFGSACAETTSASFLKIGVGARASGIGAFSALADDVTALHWNPAGLGAVANTHLEADHTEWIAGIRHDFAGVALPVGKGAVGLGGVTMDYPIIEGRDRSSRRIGDFSAGDAAMSIGYGRAASRYLRTGGVLRYIRSRVADAEAATWSADFGLQYDVPSLRSLGTTTSLAVRNMGPGLRFETERMPLPLTMSAGASAVLFGKARVGLDADYRVHEKNWKVSAGMEYVFLKGLSLRGGYGADLLQARDGWNGFRLGVGFFIGTRTRLDYAVTPMAEFGATHRASVQTRFR